MAHVKIAELERRGAIDDVVVGEVDIECVSQRNGSSRSTARCGRWRACGQHTHLVAACIGPVASHARPICPGHRHRCRRARRRKPPATLAPLPAATPETYTAHSIAAAAVQFNGVYLPRVAPDASMPSQRVR